MRLPPSVGVGSFGVLPDVSLDLQRHLPDQGEGQGKRYHLFDTNRR